MARSSAGRRASVPSDKMQIAFGYGLFTGGLGFHYGAERLGAAVIPASGGMTERQVQLIRDFRPMSSCATPSYLLVIADELRAAGHRAARECSLRLAIFGAEPWSEAMRSEIEQRLGVEACETYGLSEIIGPGVAQECPETKGTLTIWEDHFYPEIIDPETRAVLPDGEAGELVLTDADQGRHAGHPLPHARPDAPAAGRAVGAMRRIERASRAAATTC